MAKTAKNDLDGYIYEYGIDINNEQVFFHSFRYRELPNGKIGLLNEANVVVKRIKKTEIDLPMEVLGIHHNRRLFYTFNPDMNYIKDNISQYLNTVKVNAQKTIEEKEKKIVAIDQILEQLSQLES